VRYHFCLQVLLDKQDTDNPEQVYAAAIALGFERPRRDSETEFQYKEAFVIELVKVLGFERVAGQLVSAMGTAGGLSAATSQACEVDVSHSTVTPDVADLAAVRLQYSAAKRRWKHARDRQSYFRQMIPKRTREAMKLELLDPNGHWDRAKLGAPAPASAAVSAPAEMELAEMGLAVTATTEAAAPTAAAAAPAAADENRDGRTREFDNEPGPDSKKKRRADILDRGPLYRDDMTGRVVSGSFLSLLFIFFLFLSFALYQYLVSAALL